jgi:hypothetical protein
MIKNLPDWYRVASIDSVSAETLKSRSEAIINILKSKEIDWLFDCVRLYLNKPVINHFFENELVELFTSEDPLFQQKDNRLELMVLCGAMIYEFITAEYKGSISLALSLVTATFESKGVLNSDIIETVKDFLNQKSIDIREQSQELHLIESNEEEIEEGTDDEGDGEKNDETYETLTNDTYRISQINELIINLNNKIAVLDEESNIHWWIFRGYSNYKNKPINELDIEIAPLILGKELSELTKLIPGSLASRQFLMKLIKEDLQKEPSYEITIKEVVNKVESGDKGIFIESYKNTNLGNLCPLMFACQEALNIGDNSSWIAYFVKGTEIKKNAKVKVIDLANQFYLENLLVKSLN